MDQAEARGDSASQGHGLWLCWLRVVWGVALQPGLVPAQPPCPCPTWNDSLPPGQLTVALLRYSSWPSGGRWVLLLPISQTRK